MISQLNKDDLATIASNGGGLDIYAGEFSATDLAFVANAMVPGSQFIIRGPASFTVAELSLIARSGNGTVLFQG